MLINSSIRYKCKKGFDIPNYFNENGVIYYNYKETANGFNPFFKEIEQKLQDKLPTDTKSIFVYLRCKKQTMFIFSLLMVKISQILVKQVIPFCAPPPTISDKF